MDCPQVQQKRCHIVPFCRSCKGLLVEGDDEIVRECHKNLMRQAEVALGWLF